jgi:poly(A) polymerase Pap1
LDRIKKRGRKEEANLSIDTLSKLHHLHDNCFIGGENNYKEKTKSILVLDTNMDMIELCKIYDKYADQILGKKLENN